MATVIEVKSLSKKYQIYHSQQSAYKTLVETFTEKGKEILSCLKHPFDKSKRYNPDTFEEFWALDQIDFTVKEGDRLAIVGRNGSGKSTLLKILSRITEPTSGYVRTVGRVSSLLEVGTGFHPELSGRENIFLNGAILGMKKQEIKRKFDEIVDFAEIEKFLDTPVKRYSSGMYTRLGFAIAAHLDPEILIIDEVLSVGDAPFQQKCLRKLSDLGANGRTVLFVSHDIGAVSTLCNKGVYLENGKVKVNGSIESCVDEYMKNCKMSALSWKGNEGDEHIRFLSAGIKSSEKKTPGANYFFQYEHVNVEVEYEILHPHPDLILGIGIFNQRNQLLGRAYINDDQAKKERCLAPGRHRVSFTLNNQLFHEGEYIIKLDSVILNKKRIVGEEISLKYPVFTSPESVQSGAKNFREGVILGQKWDIHEGASDG